jgi:hypothetical protein
VCNKANLVYILFNRSTVSSDFQIIRNAAIRRTLFDYYGLSAYTGCLPVILGSASGWAPVKAMPILFWALSRLCKVVSKNAGDGVLENVQKVMAYIEEALNSGKKDLNFDKDFYSVLNGWSSYLYDQLEKAS